MNLRKVERHLNIMIEEAEKRTRRSYTEEGSAIFNPKESDDYDRLTALWYELKEDEFYYFGGGGNNAGCMLPAPDAVFDGAW